MEAFWERKLSKTPHKDKILHAIEKINSNMWTSRHLQQMSDPTSDFYKEAKDQGIPTGLLRDLRKNLHDFKELWRTGRALRDLSH